MRNHSTAPPHNGPHPTADALPVINFQSFGAAGDAGRRRVCSTCEMFFNWSSTGPFGTIVVGPLFPMRRQLSSRQTVLAKFVIPATIFAAAAALLAIFFAAPLLSDEPFTPGGALISLVVAGVLIRWGSAYLPLKAVSLDGQHLRVSNYRREIAVPLSEVKQVAEVEQFKQKLIVLSLRRPTEFGREIKFLPRAQPRLWKEHSVVGELRGLIESRGDCSQ